MISNKNKARFCILLCASMSISAQASQLEKNNSSDYSVSGSVMIDYDRSGAFYNKDSSQSQSHFELRRSKISLEYQPSKTLESKLDVEYSKEYQDKEEISIGSAVIKYSGLSTFDISLGYLKEPYSLEKQTSSKHLSTIERSLLNNAFAPGTSLGFKLGQKKKNTTWAIGAFQERSDSDTSSSDVQQAITSRLTWAPLNESGQVFHLGVSFSLRDLKDQELKFKENGEVNSADNIIKSDKINVSNMTLGQLEGAWVSGSLRLQGEAGMADIKQSDGAHLSYQGFYIQSSFLLNGGHYRYKKGKFKSISPQTHMGALEFVARYSGLNLKGNDEGSEASVMLLGMNYYPSKQLKLMVNVLLPDISGDVVNTDQSGNAVSARLQYAF